MRLDENIVGTSGPDELSATAERQALFGRGGEDRLFTTFNHSYLVGGDGADSLFATVAVEETGQDTALATTTIDAGSGNDYIVVDLQAMAESDATALSFTDVGSNDANVRPGYGTASIQTSAVSRGGGVATATNLARSGDSGGTSLSLAAQAGNEAGSGGSTRAINRFTGGSGDDLVNFYALAEPAVDGSISINSGSGGSGSDRFHVTSYAWAGDTSLALTSLSGGKGNDTLFSQTYFRGEDAGGRSQIREDGGAGSDFLYGHTYADATATFDNRLLGGSGDDQINSGIAYEDADGSRGAQTLAGAAGDDLIIASVIFQRWSAIGGTDDTVNISGGQGADDIRFTSGSYRDDPQRDVTVEKRFTIAFDATGGTGDDRMTIEHYLSSLEFGSRITTRCDGGAGDDNIFVATVGNVISTVSLCGGAGNDTLIASSLFGPSAEHLFSGGAGDDLIVSEIDATADGIHRIHGGTGNDTFIISGAVSRIEGGAGNDTIEGNGTDVTMIGGFGQDVFVIGSGGDGVRRIEDFDRDRDTLQIKSLIPSGTGTLDDLLATTEVEDLGRGRDVIVRFDRGLVLVLEGVGTGHADDLTDVVDNFLF
ncbi:calcium-binding protein [Rhodobacter sp. NSM]|uniref:calcium-binding protein n=1 Tax=Rhodobacter sp. NSM TaxID=3457501 RepID=UPI003FCF6522